MKYIITSLLAISIIFANVNSAYAFSFKKNTTETATEKVKLTKEEKQALKAAKAEEKKQIKEQIKQEKQQAKEEQKLIKQQQKELKKAAKKQNKKTEEQTDEISQTEELQNTENQTQDIITDKKTAKQQAKALKKEQKEQAKALKKEQKEQAKAQKQALKEAEKQAKAKTRENRGVKKRSALAIFLNPNLDIYEVRASHILVKKRKDAVAIRNDIIKGEITFEEAAQRYSLCPSGLNGGDLGYFHRKKMEQLFADTAFDLKIGEISQPVGTKFGWHIIKTTDKR